MRNKIVLKKKSKTNDLYFDKESNWIIVLLLGILFILNAFLTVLNEIYFYLVSIGFVLLVLYAFRDKFYTNYFYINRFWITIKTSNTIIFQLPLHKIINASIKDNYLIFKTKESEHRILLLNCSKETFLKIKFELLKKGIFIKS